MTESEFLYLMGGSDEDVSDFYEAGIHCYEEGWIDDFGFLTPKGQKAMEEYE